MRQCSINGCRRKHAAKGYCRYHYRRLWDGLPVHPQRVSGNREEASARQKTYLSWKAMRQRCYYTGDSRYDRYGGRGIKVYDKWLYSFNFFVDDMGLKPDSMTLDRIDNDGDYEPNNCRWATVRQQNANRSVSMKQSGVRYEKQSGKWIASLKVGKRWVLRKKFSTEQEALQARKTSEAEYL